jgi:enoyl-[acyl-carrier-protein] reductase (NADH)
MPAVEERAAGQNATPEELLKRMADNNSIKHLVTADEVAHVVTFLCSPLSIAINGETIAAGGGTPRAIYY